MKKSKTVYKKVNGKASKKSVTTKLPNKVVNNREYTHTVTAPKIGKTIDAGLLLRNRMNELGVGPSEVGKMAISPNKPTGLTRQHVNQLTRHVLDNPIELIATLSKALDFNLFRELADLLEPEIQNNKVEWIVRAQAAISPQGKDSKKFVESIDKAKKEYVTAKAEREFAKEFAEKSKVV